MTPLNTRPNNRRGTIGLRRLQTLVTERDLELLRALSEHRLPASADHHDWELRLGARRRYYLDYAGRGRSDRVRSQHTDVPEPEGDQPEE